MKKSSKNILGVAVLSLIFPLAAQNSFACGDDTEAKWHSPDAGTSALTIEEAAGKLASTAGVTVEKAPYQARCSSDVDYIVKDKSDGQYLGAVPIPSKLDEGRYLMVRVQQLLTPSKEHVKTQMKNLSKARKAFFEDSEILEGALGINFYNPSALPLKDQFPNSKKQLLYATTEYCGDPDKKEWGYMSSNVLMDDVLQNTFSYIPGRADYSEGTVYKEGDLKRFILDNQAVYDALFARAQHNVKFCDRNGYGDQGKASKWGDIVHRLKMLSLTPGG